MSLAIDTLDRLIVEQATRLNELATLVGPDWHTYELGEVAGHRLAALRDARDQVRDAEMRALEGTQTRQEAGDALR